VKRNAAPPGYVELVPVTAAELRQRMEQLLSRVAPRVISDARLPTGKSCFAQIEASMLVSELKRWDSSN
jgi:hypothetical protein